MRRSRGLKQVFLLTTALSLMLSTSTLAYNNDDIRRLVGRPEVDTIEFHDYLDYIDSLERPEEIQQGTNTRKESLLGRVQQMEQTQQLKLQDLTESLQSGNMLYTELEAVNSLSAISKSLNNFKLSSYFTAFTQEDPHPTSWYLEQENIAQIKSEVAYARTLTNDTYDIGGIGTVKQYPLRDTNTPALKVATGFKGTIPEDSTQQINGTYFTLDNITPEQAVIAMFNGIVTKVETSTTYGKWLEVQSGKGLRISYSFLDNIQVIPGQSVQQGDILSIGTQNNTVYIEALLDNTYINPCILLGEQGILAHNRWYSLYPEQRGSATQEVYQPVPNKSTSSIWETVTKNINKADITEVPTQDNTEQNAWEDTTQNY